jgi:hypothetical protein
MSSNFQGAGPPSGDSEAKANGPQYQHRDLSGTSTDTATTASSDSSAHPTSAPGSHPGGRMNGDVSRMLENLPKISPTELKPGDALVISGGAGGEPSHLTAINVIAGVEPLFASAPPSSRNSNALAMWNLDIATPGEQ